MMIMWSLLMNTWQVTDFNGKVIDYFKDRKEAENFIEKILKSS